MKFILRLSVLAILVGAFAGRCLAMMSIEEVTKERAKALGMEVHVNAGGPDVVRVELEFDVAGELKSYARVDMEVTEKGKLLFSSSLKEEKAKAGHVVVSFAADRGQLDKITLRVVSGVPRAMVGHDLRVKDFVDLKNLNAAAPEKEAAFLAAVRKAFEARDGAALEAMTCWDGMSEKRSNDLKRMYATLVADKGEVFTFKLADPERGFVDRDRVEDGATYRANLPIIRQLELKGQDPKDQKRTLFLLCMAVGEKDGKLVLVGWAADK
jgi:hypothetical protein